VNLNYLTPKAQSRSFGDTGRAFAIETIRGGETIAVFGGFPVDRATLDTFPASRRVRSIQIDDELYLLSGETSEPGDRIYHSCAPNCGMMGNIVVVAMRDIAPGEELTFDYAMSDGSDYDEFDCDCGAPACRGRITGNDWLLPELQRAYRGWFSPYLTRRIARLVTTGFERRVFAV
jgi:uncharacterized protein